MTSSRQARNPHLLFREMIKNSLNSSERNIYFYCRAMVMSIDTKGGILTPDCPPNTLKVKIFKPQLNTNDAGETIVWPLQEYNSYPIFPFETVLCAFEDDKFNFGYWITRIPDQEKSYVTTSETIIAAPNSNQETLGAFGIDNNSEPQVTEENIVRSLNSNYQDEINKWKKFKKVVKFDKREQDHVIFCKNTSRIVLGNDRLNSKDSGYLDEGEAIDVVVGVKNTDNGNSDFANDSSRIYLSSKSKQIEGTNNTDAESVAFVKADNICLVGRQDFVIKSEEHGVTFKIDRSGNVSISGAASISLDGDIPIIRNSDNVNVSLDMGTWMTAVTSALTAIGASPGNPPGIIGTCQASTTKVKSG